MKRYPILSFFILAFMLGAGLIALVFQGFIPDQLALSSALSASIAGIFMTAYLDGKGGLRLLFQRLSIWRVRVMYWFFALLFIIPAILVGSLFNPLFGGDPISFESLHLSISTLPIFLAFVLAAGVGQELGWSGFLTPRLQARFSALTSSLIRAVMVLLWHGPLLVYTYYQPNGIPDFPYGGWMVQKGILVTLLVMSAFTFAWSVLTTWIFNNTRGSLLLAAVLHGSEFWLAVLLTGLGINTKNLNNFWGYGIILLLTAISIVIHTGPQDLSRKQERIKHQ